MPSGEHDIAFLVFPSILIEGGLIGISITRRKNSTTPFMVFPHEFIAKVDRSA
jgi:hypothetical protein